MKLINPLVYSYISFGNQATLFWKQLINFIQFYFII